MDEIRATARLAPLTIEVSHRRSPSHDAETLTISLTARPDFAVAARTLKAEALSAMPWMTPFAGWIQLMGMAWRPWLSLMAPPAAAAARTRAEEPWRNGSNAGNDINDVEYREVDSK